MTGVQTCALPIFISLENGKYKASLVLAHKIAQFFNVTIEEMFLFDREEENL